MNTLTIINVKTGQVDHKEFDTVASGQVLLQGCSDGFIETLIASAQAGNQSGAAFKQALTPPVTQAETQAAKIRIAAAKGKDSCCAGGTGSAGRPTEAEVTAALANATKQDDNITLPTEADLPTLQSELVNLLIKDAAFVQALADAVKKSKSVNPDGSLPTAKNISIALALYVHYGIETVFSTGEGAKTFTGYVSGGKENIRRLLTDFNILEVATGRLAQTKYRVTKSFERLVLTTINKREHSDLQDKADEIQSVIELIY